MASDAQTNQKLVDQIDGLSTTFKVVTNVPYGGNAAENDQEVAITRRGSTSTLVVNAELLDGAETQRYQVATGQYDYGHLFYYFTSAVGSPSVTVRLYFGGLSTLSISPSLSTEWVEYMFPEYLSPDPTFLSASVSDATDPSAALVAAVSGMTYRVYSYSLIAGGTAVNAGLEDSDGTDLTPLWPFAINGGGIWPGTPPGKHYIQPAEGKGIRIDKSAAQTVAGNLIYRKHPLVVTAAAEGIVIVPRVETFAIELVGTGTAGVDQITVNMRFVGYY